MTRSEYTKRVLSQIKGATRQEEESIRSEIDAHMEDWVLDLMDHGYTEEIAEQRAVERMGDPEEVGRELNKQYPLRWLVLGDLAVGLSICMGLLLCLLLAVGEPSMVKALERRWVPEPLNQSEDYLETVEAEETLNLRCTMGNDILRIFRVTVGEQEGRRMAMVHADTFDRIPLGASACWTEYALLEDQRGQPGQVFANCDLWSRYYEHWYHQAYLGVPVEPGDTYVTLRCERYGESVECRIPLPEEGTP